MSELNTKSYYYDYETRTNQSYHNYQDGGVPETPLHEAFMDNIQRNTAIIGVAISILSFLINVLVIYACRRDSAISKDVYYGQIVNFSVVNVLISVTVTPLTVYYILHPWMLGHILCKTMVIFDVLLPFTSFTILLIMNIDRILWMSHPNVYVCTFRKCLTQLVILSPWLIAVSIVEPLWTSGSLPYPNRPGECIVVITSVAAIVCPLLTYFIPLIVLIILTLRMLLLQIEGQHRGAPQRTCATERPTTRNDSMVTDCTEKSEMVELQSRAPTTEEKRYQGNSVTVLCVVNFLFVTTWFPYQCISFMLATCSSQSCLPSIALNQSVTWLGTSSTVFVPLAWFMDKDVLNSLKKMCFVRSRSSKFEPAPPSEETFV